MVDSSDFLGILIFAKNKRNTYASCYGCDGDLSCLDTCKVLTFKAITPEQMELKFKLFTNEKHDNPIDFTGAFADNDWTDKLRNGILTSQPHKYSVFYVDWSKSIPDFNYARALNNVAVVCYALYIHLVGHSLGTHIAEIAGRKIQNPKISRITGIDPATPWVKGT
uniref:Lipase domain-containing protein n=1 Tax=Tetranychus urticae TaxID=32264 RepID=T1L335_TETUR